jgi:ATP-binding cassette subfamily F protein 3
MDNVGSHLLYCSGSGKPVLRKGSFSRFIALQEELEEQRGREAARIQEDIERKMDFVRRFKAKATKARQAASRQKMAKKMEKELEGLRAEPRRRELAFSWPVPARSDRTVLSVAGLTFAFPDGLRLWQSLSFTLYRGQKIALVGPNGCGKSTLIRLLAGRLEKGGGSIAFGQQVRPGYFSQHQLDTLVPSGTVLGEIRRLADPRTSEEELMSVLGLFLLGRGFFDRLVGSLSGGEKSRLILASLFLARCNLLLLDEPTNHLDLESREALVEALAAFEGSLLMIAHDRHLLAEAAEQVWLLSPAGLTLFEDGFEQYQESRRQDRLAQSDPKTRRGESSTASGPREDLKQRKRDQAQARKALYREIRPLQEEYSLREKDLEDVLARLAETEALLADPECYADSARSSALLTTFHTLHSRSEALLEDLARTEASLRAIQENGEAGGNDSRSRRARAKKGLSLKPKTGYPLREVLRGRKERIPQETGRSADEAGGKKNYGPGPSRPGDHCRRHHLRPSRPGKGSGGTGPRPPGRHRPEGGECQGQLFREFHRLDQGQRGFSAGKPGNVLLSVH